MMKRCLSLVLILSLVATSAFAQVIRHPSPQEVDPVFSAWDKDYSDLINTPDLSVYLTDESDPVWSVDKALYQTAAQADAKYLQSYDETDPVWSVDKSLYQTASQADAKYIQSESDPVWASEKVDYYTATQIDQALYLQTESDPIYSAWDKDYGDLINRPDLSIYLTAESDPVWLSEKASYATTSSLSGYVPTSRTINGQALTSDITIDGMIYPASGIAKSTGTAWTTSISGTSGQFVKGDGSLDSSSYLTSYTETDPKVGTITAGKLPKGNGAILVDSAIYENSGNVGINSSSLTSSDVLKMTGNGSATVSINATPDDVSGTGGTITDYESGGVTYRVHSFTSAGAGTFVAPNPGRNCRVLVVAGGGGGKMGGGGGGGVVYHSSFPVSAGESISLSVGAGGGQATTGSNSTFGAITALGGGGSSTGGNGNGNGQNGGSGGGASYTGTGGTALQGDSGGGTGYGNNGANNARINTGGGGGGAGGAGSASGSNYVGGSGGTGFTTDITGSSVCYGGGGGGGGSSSGGGASCGGGAGGVSGTANSGTVNRGGGGGGLYSLGTGGSGGRGVVIVSYALNGSLASKPKVSLKGNDTEKWSLLSDGDNSDALTIKDSSGTSKVTVAQTTGLSTFAGGITSTASANALKSITLSAGTTSAGTAPLYFTTGTSLTNAVAGAMEYTTDDLFFTIGTGTARKRLLMADPVGGLTSTRVPFATTNGRLTDDSDLTFATDTLTATKVVGSTSVSTPSLISTGAVTITPTAGNNLNVALSGAGDLAVNTNDLYVDTSTARIGINTSSPTDTLDVKSGGTGGVKIDSQAEITGGCDSYASALYHFDNASTDSNCSGSGAQNAAASSGVSYTTGKFGGATGGITFAASSSYIDYPITLGAFGSSDFTIDTWINMDSVTTCFIASVHGADNNNIWEFEIYNTGVIVFNVYSGGSKIIEAISSAGVVTSGGWHHVAVVRLGSSFNIYYDGASVASTTDTDAIPSFNDYLEIGNRNRSTYRFTGTIDEFRVSKGLARWTSNFTPPTAPYDNTSSGNPAVNFFVNNAPKSRIWSDGNDSDSLKFDVGSSLDTKMTISSSEKITIDGSLYVGAGTPEHIIVDKSLYVSGDLEVDGVIYNDQSVLGTASNGVQIGESGIVYTGTARPKRSFFVSSTGMFPTITAGAGDPTKAETTTYKVNYYSSAFSGTEDKSTEFTTPLPKSWDGGTVSVIFYYIPTGTTDGTGITWGIKGVLIGDNVSMDTDYGTEVKVSDTIQTADRLHLTPETDPITISGTLAGDQVIQWKITRDADADSNTDDAKLVGVLIKFTATQETDAQ